MRILATLIIVGVIAFLVVAMLEPRCGSYTRAFLGIVNTLRQIDAAKEQFMIHSNVVPGSVVSREQLLLYIPNQFWNSHADYHINALGVPPEAVLLSQFDSLPARTVIRLQTNNPGYQIILPNQ